MHSNEPYWILCPKTTNIIREFGIRKVLKKLVISLIICTFIGDNQQVTNKVKAMITKDKVTEIFCIIDEFNKNLNTELENNLFLPTHNGKGKRYRNRKGRLSESEIMTILVCYHFGTYRNFKEYYLNCIRGQLKQELPDAVSFFLFALCLISHHYYLFVNFLHRKSTKRKIAK